MDHELAVGRVLLELDDVDLGGDPADLCELGDLDAIDLDGEVVRRERVGGQVGRPPGMAWFLLGGSDYSLTAAPPENWAMRKITNSAGLTGAIPISTTSCPASMTSGGFVSASHLT